jgi:RNA recognition motif-containing protein
MISGSASRSSIFLGGVPPEATLRDVYEAIKREVKIDKGWVLELKGKSDKCNHLGFGFIHCENEHASEVFSYLKSFTVKGKIVECKQGWTIEEHKHKTDLDRQRKIYVSCIKKNTRKSTLVEYFSTFGKVKDVVIGKDKVSGRKLGFCVVEFVNEEDTNRVLALAEHSIQGKLIKCQRMMLKHELHTKPKEEPHDKVQGSKYHDRHAKGFLNQGEFHAASCLETANSSTGSNFGHYDGKTEGKSVFRPPPKSHKPFGFQQPQSSHADFAQAQHKYYNNAMNYTQYDQYSPFSHKIDKLEGVQEFDSQLPSRLGTRPYRPFGYTQIPYSQGNPVQQRPGIAYQFDQPQFPGPSSQDLAFTVFPYRQSAPPTLEAGGLDKGYANHAGSPFMKKGYEADGFIYSNESEFSGLDPEALGLYRGNESSEADLARKQNLQQITNQFTKPASIVLHAQKPLISTSSTKQ